MEDGNSGSFEDMFKKFDEIKFSRKTFEPDELHNIPMGSQEFQKALFSCTDQDNDDVAPRHRSHTIDSSYTKPKRHLAVHFACDILPAEDKAEKKENGSASERLDKIMKNHLGVANVRQRSNTLDNAYRKDKKFVTHPESKHGHHSPRHNSHKHSNESLDDKHRNVRTDKKSR